MFCPQCKAEYRAGFTRCADCDLDLVSSPAIAQEGALNPIPTGTLAPLWEGEDLALHATLLEELDSAGIGRFDQPMGVYPGARRGDHFPIQPMTRFGYQVAVLSSDLPSAKRILERVLTEQPDERGLPVNEKEQSETTEYLAGPGEKATIEIWAAQDNQVSGFLRSALSENGILWRSDKEEHAIKVYVRPSDEQRAREIVREIVEGAPPE